MLLRNRVIVKRKLLRKRIICVLTKCEVRKVSDLYKRLSELCEERGISGYKMCKDIGIQPSIMTDLKMGRRSSVKAETADKMANYFGVSVGYLLGKTDQKEKPLVNGDEELTEYLEILKTRPEMRMLFSLAKSATKEDVEKAVRIIEAALGK